MKLLNKLVDHIMSCPIGKVATSVDDSQMKCSYSLQLSVRDTHRDFLRHCKTDSHIRACGWTIEPNFATTTRHVFETRPFSGPLDQFLNRASGPILEDPEEFGEL